LNDAASNGSQALAVGHLDVLRWAREQHHPWDEETCAAAARGGHLEVLQWARRRGCPWGEGTCADAAYGRVWQLMLDPTYDASSFNTRHLIHYTTV